jgi:hypothetical protein
MPRPPFNMLRACFLLLAAVILIEVFTAISGGLVCVYLNFLTVREIGSCQFAASQIRDIFSEVLTAVLALLLAARGPRPPDDDNAPHG